MTSKLRVRVIATAALATFSFTVSLSGQSAGTAAPTGSTGATTTVGGTTGTTTGSTGGTTGVSRLPTTPNTTTPATPTQTPTIQQPIYISGRVVMEDGQPAGQQVTIETVCNGVGHAEGYVDSRGYFSIELGKRNGVLQDASESNTFGSFGSMGSGSGSSSPFDNGTMATERKYMGCDLQAKLVGYRSQTVSLTGRRPLDNPDVGTLLLHRMGAAEEGQTISAVSLGAPKDARKAYDKGMDALKKHKFADAQANFEKAVEIYPKFASVWYELGMLQAGQGRMDMARKYFDLSVQNDPKFVKPYLQIASLELQASRWPALSEVTEKLIKLDPFDYPQVYYYHSVANYNLQRFPEAEKSALEAERLDTRHAIPGVSHLLGLILVLKKDYSGAAEHLKAYLKMDPTASDAPKVRSQLADIEKITAAMATKN